MAYLGNRPAESYASFERQVFTIVNSQTAYTLSHSVTNENDIRLVVNNVVQEPGSGKAYTASGTTLTLSAALTNGTDEMYCVFLGRALQTVNPPNASVGSTQIADDLISGKTALASEPADTDEFLVSDAGTLKRIDYSLIKGGGITMADQWRVTTAFSGDAAPIANNWERNDTAPSLSYFGSQMSESSGIFTFPSTGIYEIHFMIQYKLDGSDSVANQSFIQGTTNNSSYVNLTEASTNIIHGGSGDLYSSSTQTALVDITDTSTHKVRFSVSLANSGVEMSANTARDILAVRFIRLGDT